MRASKTVNEVQTDFVWNGQNLAAEKKDGALNTYTYDITGIHIAKNNGNVNSYLKDEHGNVIGKVNPLGEKQNVSYEYDAFGNQLEDEPDPFGYCGEYWDSESGLIYLRNRYYDSEIGRFINEDPIRDGLNWYSYCGGNPITRFDFTGLSYDDVIDALSKISNAKNTMNHTTPGNTRYDNAYKIAIEQKDVIRNSDVYIEDWGGLTDVLSPIVNGNNNSIETINETKSIVEKAKEKSQNANKVDDILFVSSITAIIVPIIHIGASALAATSSEINFAPSAAKHMTEVSRYVPVTILKQAIKNGVASPDPKGSKAIMYTIEMYRNNVAYTLEVLYGSASNTIYHFMYHH